MNYRELYRERDVDTVDETRIHTEIKYGNLLEKVPLEDRGDGRTILRLF
jgi:hypothetical protein